MAKGMTTYKSNQGQKTRIFRYDDTRRDVVRGHTLTLQLHRHEKKKHATSNCVLVILDSLRVLSLLKRVHLCGHFDWESSTLFSAGILRRKHGEDPLVERTEDYRLQSKGREFENIYLLAR